MIEQKRPDWSIKSNRKRRLLFDMDGTLCDFKLCKDLSELYVPGYFEALKPHENVVKAAKLALVDESVDVFVLSAYLSDSATALKEKHAWLDKYLPKLDADHRLFIPNGTKKSSVFGGGISRTDTLLDDFTRNLLDWDSAGGRAVKLLNGINHTRGTWTGSKVSLGDCPVSLFLNLLA